MCVKGVFVQGAVGKGAEVARPNSKVFQSVGSPSAPPASSMKNLNLFDLPAPLSFVTPRDSIESLGKLLTRGRGGGGDTGTGGIRQLQRGDDDGRGCGWRLGQRFGRRLPCLRRQGRLLFL